MRADQVPDEVELYVAAVCRWGSGAQFDLCQEELAELIAAVSWYKRGRITEVQLADEIADVEIMLGQLRILINPELIDSAKHAKLIRLQQRLGAINPLDGAVKMVST